MLTMRWESMFERNARRTARPSEMCQAWSLDINAQLGYHIHRVRNLTLWSLSHADRRSHDFGPSL